jgi:hypothetical protein
MKTKYPPRPRLNISHSTVQGGLDAVNVEVGSIYWGPGNIDSDPIFAGAAGGDYRPAPVSPCTNAGDPDYLAGPDETDLDGGRRIVGGQIDMGAYEFDYVEAEMKFTPKVINSCGEGRWVKAHLVLPEGFTVADVNRNSPLMIVPFGIQSEYMDVFTDEDGFAQVEVAFDRGVFCGAGAEYDLTDVTVLGLLTDGRYFGGRDGIHMMNKNTKCLSVFASYWLRGDCDSSDWCDGLDLNQDSAVDFIDFALLFSCRCPF